MIPDNRTQSFELRFPSVELDVDDIWPDGNAPDNPTAEDVARVIKNASWWRFLTEWNCVTEVEVYGFADKSAAEVRQYD